MKRAISFLAASCTLLCLSAAVFVIYGYDSYPELSIRLGWIGCGFGIVAVASAIALQTAFSKR